LQIKGLSAPVDAYEVTGPGPLHSHFQVAIKRGLVKFVGRLRETQEIGRALELARLGYGQIVAVIGEAGVGKSRLLHQFKEDRPSDWLMLETAAFSYGSSVPYHIVIEFLRYYFRLLPGDSQQLRREKVESKLVAYHLQNAIPYLCALLGLPSDTGKQE